MDPVFLFFFGETSDSEQEYKKSLQQTEGTSVTVVMSAISFTLWRSSVATFCSPFQWRSLLPSPRASNTPPFSISSSFHGRRNSRKRRKSPSDQRIEMVIDVQDVADRASISLRRFLAESEAKFNGFVTSGKEAFSDLQSLVVIDKDRRIIISCSRSSLRFLGNCFLWSILIAVIARFVVRFGVWGLGGGYRGFLIRRDRSLAGREVVVGRRTERKKSGFNFKALVNPLSPARGTVRSRDEQMTLPSRNRVSTERKLPNWWPDPVSYSAAPTTAKQEHQKEAQRVIRAIMDNRMSGKDITEDDIIQFRKVCRASGARVYIETTNARDSFYRASVDFVLSSCSSSACHSYLSIDGEDPRQFIAGLADNIGLESTHASRIVSAAVAARTRSHFLQAWALEMQRKRDEAVLELSKICLIHKIFPPEESSPEMEMVARGLSRHLRTEQRELLLNLLRGTCDAESGRSAAEALGLAHRSSV